MRKFIGGLLVLCLMCGVRPVWAGGNNGHDNGPDNSVHNSASAVSAASAGAQAGAAVIGSGNSAVKATQSMKAQQNTTVSVDAGDVPRQAPAVVAPGMSVGTFVCRASVVMGATTPFGGVTGGYPMRDDTCERVVLSIALSTLGERAVALEILNGDERVREARERLSGVRKGALKEGAKVQYSVVTPDDHINVRTFGFVGGQ